MEHHWSVEVTRDGETLVTIASNCLSGKPEFTEEEAQTIRDAARNLDAFIGSPPPRPSSSHDEPWRAYVQHKIECSISIWGNYGGFKTQPRPDCTCGLAALLSESEPLAHVAAVLSQSRSMTNDERKALVGIPLMGDPALPAPLETRTIRAHVVGCPKALSVPVDLCECGGRDFTPAPLEPTHHGTLVGTIVYDFANGTERFERAPLETPPQVVLSCREIWVNGAEHWCEGCVHIGRSACVRLPPETQERPAMTFQSRVDPWMQACFGAEISRDCTERNHRFLEEALELAQSCGCTESEAQQLVSYVYARPAGDLVQEAGGVMVTLAALCLAQEIDMHDAGETELARVWRKIDTIRARQAAKPKHSPLPAAPSSSTGAVPLPQEEESTFVAHARKQGAADGFQQGWHAALQRIREGDKADELAAAVPLPSGWRGIESAPKDGTWVLLWQPDQGENVACWMDCDISWWFIEDGKNAHALRGAAPTHWMPLPAPPAAGE